MAGQTRRASPHIAASCLERNRRHLRRPCDSTQRCDWFVFVFFACDGDGGGAVGYRKSKDIREQEGNSPCMLQVNTARAGLITLQLLADSEQPGAFEAREAFLRAAVPFLQRHKSSSDAPVMVPVPQPAATSVALPAAPSVGAPTADANPASRADASADTLVSMSAVGEISVHSPTPSSSGHVVYCVTFKVHNSSLL